MRKQAVTPANEVIKVATSSLKVVHSSLKKERSITRTISGTPSVAPQPIYYSSSYSKDGPGGNYQGF